MHLMRVSLSFQGVWLQYVTFMHCLSKVCVCVRAFVCPGHGPSLHCAAGADVGRERLPGPPRGTTEAM